MGRIVSVHLASMGDTVCDTVGHSSRQQHGLGGPDPGAKDAHL